MYYTQFTIYNTGWVSVSTHGYFSQDFILEYVLHAYMGAIHDCIHTCPSELFIHSVEMATLILLEWEHVVNARIQTT